MSGFNEAGDLPLNPNRHLTKEEMDEKKKTTEKTEGEWIKEWYLNQPMDSDPQTIRAHMWMLE